MESSWEGKNLMQRKVIFGFFYSTCTIIASLKVITFFYKPYSSFSAKEYIPIDDNLVESGISQVISLNNVCIIQEDTFPGLWVQLCILFKVAHHMHNTFNKHTQIRIINLISFP